MSSESVVRFRCLDGLDLVGDLTVPDGSPTIGVVQVHGRGVTRHEAGFFDRMAAGLADAGMAALRFDVRGHESRAVHRRTSPSREFSTIFVPRSPT